MFALFVSKTFSNPKVCSIAADHTAVEYFHRNQERLFPNAHIDIATTCLTYLSFEKFERRIYQNYRELESLLIKYPFYVYAAQNWGHHARGEAEESIKDMALNFLRDGPKVDCASNVMLMRRKILPRRSTSGLHVSAFFGLETILRHQLENTHMQADASLGDGSNRTPLLFAARNGH